MVVVEIKFLTSLLHKCMFVRFLRIHGRLTWRILVFTDCVQVCLVWGWNGVGETLDCLETGSLYISLLGGDPCSSIVYQCSKKNLIITCIVARVLWKGIVGVYVLEYRPTLNCWVKFPVRKCVAFCWVQKLIWFNVIKMIIFDWIYNSLYICMKKNKNILYTLRFLFSILLRQTSNNKNDCISYKTADDCFFLREAKVLQYIISSPGEQIEPC